jgi:hypothetical protein
MLDCWQAAGSVAPINVAFLIEGEEENGSTGFSEALQVEGRKKAAARFKNALGQSKTKVQSVHLNS